VRNEISHLLDEESFFGEQGFVRGGLKPKGDTGTLARNGTATTPSASTTPSSSTTDPAVASAPESTNPVAAPTVSGAPISDPLTDTNVTVSRVNTTQAESLLTQDLTRSERDPIAQLASELGIKPREVQDGSARRAVDNAQDEVQWLEQRLATTKSILMRLAEIARTLEQRLEK
jgi:hypothetical protein